MRSAAGQATTEYVAVLALLVVVLVGAGTAVAAPDLPRAVVHHLRVALCIVGGDICRSVDAARAGLAPCVVTGEEHARETGVSLLVFRSSGGELWSVQRRSDGTVALSASYDQHLGATAGVGLELGPVLSLGASADAEAGFRSGRTWELPDEGALKRLLARVHGFDLANGVATEIATEVAGFPKPDATFLEGGGGGGVGLAAAALKDLPVGTGDARAAVGRRTGHGRTTYYLDLGGDTSGPLVDALSALDLHGRVLAEWTTGDPPAITLRTVGSGHRDEETETVAQLRLDDPADLAAARRVAFLDLADPTLAARELVRRIARRGTVQRFTYRTTTEDDDWSYSLSLGVKLGADHSTSVVHRKLVDARVLNRPVPARRADCLGI